MIGKNVSNGWKSLREADGARLEAAPPEAVQRLCKRCRSASGGAASCRAVVQGMCKGLGFSFGMSNAGGNSKHAKGDEGVVGRQGKPAEKPRARAFRFPPPAEAPDHGGVEQRDAHQQCSNRHPCSTLYAKRIQTANHQNQRSQCHCGGDRQWNQKQAQEIGDRVNAKRESRRAGGKEACNLADDERTQQCQQFPARRWGGRGAGGGRTGGRHGGRPARRGRGGICFPREKAGKERGTGEIGRASCRERV